MFGNIFVTLREGLLQGISDGSNVVAHLLLVSVKQSFQLLFRLFIVVMSSVIQTLKKKETSLWASNKKKKPAAGFRRSWRSPSSRLKHGLKGRIYLFSVQIIHFCKINVWNEEQKIEEPRKQRIHIIFIKSMTVKTRFYLYTCGKKLWIRYCMRTIHPIMCEGWCVRGAGRECGDAPIRG